MIMNVKTDVSIGALLLASIAVYILPLKLAAAYLLAVLTHELGHMLLLLTFDKRIYAVHICLSGFVIEHERDMSSHEDLLCALAGPCFGLLYAAFASTVSAETGSEWLRFSAGISLALSVFNSLPIMPLDGGRALNCLLKLMLPGKHTDTASYIISLGVCLMIFAFGALLAIENKGYGLLIAAVMLFALLLSGKGL